MEISSARIAKAGRNSWQPHGSQFTIHTEVPDEAVKFQVRVPPTRLNKEDVLEVLRYDDSWVTILRDQPYPEIQPTLGMVAETPTEYIHKDEQNQGSQLKS